MDEKYVEDSTLTFPVIAEGLISLGDLWDCRTSKSVGFSLFTGALNERHLRVRTINASDYSLTHERGTAYKIQKLNVTGGIELDLLAGFIKGGLDGLYDVEHKCHSEEEKLNCHYLLHTHSVQLEPSAKEALDEDVKEKLIQRSIKATHVVSKVTFGAEINAVISIKEKNSERQSNIKGGFDGKLKFGKMTAGLKAALQKLDTDDCKSIDKSITLYSKPPIGNPPTTISQMFEQIESAYELIKKEKPFKKFQEMDVVGVPLHLVLVPIQQFLNLQIEKIYLQLTGELFKSFKEMLINLVDFQSDAYAKKQVLVKEPSLSVLFSDPNSPLSKKIAMFESELRVNAAKHFQKCFEDFRKFKIGKVNEEILLQNVKDFIESEHSILKVGLMIEQFLFEGRKELSDLHYSDSITLEADIEYITSHETLAEWEKSQVGIRILVLTKNAPMDSAFRHLFDMSVALQRMGIRVGIASSSISDDYLLQVNAYGQLKKYSEVLFILKIIAALIGASSNTTETLFYKLNASEFKIHLPLKCEQLKDLNNAISILKVNSSVQVATSAIETLAKLKRDDNQWKFFLTLDCKNTAKDAVRKLRIFQPLIVVKNADWLVGTLGICDEPAGPLLFVFLNGQVRAVCFDKLDLLILVDVFKKDCNEPNFDMLAAGSVKHSLYGDRSSYALKVMKVFNNYISLDDSLHSLSDEPPNDVMLILQSHLDKMVSLDCNEVIKLLSAMSREITAEQWGELWEVKKFVYLVLLHVKDSLIIHALVTFLRSIGIKSVPDYIPDDVRSHLTAQWNDELDLPDKFCNLEEMLRHFHRIMYIREIPNNFIHVLTRSVTGNELLRNELQAANALLFWDSVVFTEPWDLESIQLAVENIEKMQQKTKDANKVSEDIKIDIVIDPEQDKNSNTHVEQRKGITLGNEWKTLLGDSIVYISPADFVKVTEMLPMPKVTMSDDTGCLKKVLLYVLQNLRMWGGHILQPEHISSFLMEVDSNSSEDDSDDPYLRNKAISIKPETANKSLQISRLDIVVSLLSTLNCADARHILRVISSFPLAIPLVIPDIQHEDHFLILSHWLMGCMVKWETSTGNINENHLFSSPFQMIVAIRLGTNDCGKSTILNQLFLNQYMFSSSNEPGSDRGSPLLLNGVVEIAYLTQERCKTALVVPNLQKHYAEDGSNLLLLANLHGDGLSYKEILQFLDQIASCFIVFVMPDEEEKIKQKLEELSSIVKKKTVLIQVDPKDRVVSSKQYAIETKHLYKELIIKIFQNVLKKTMKLHFDPTKTCDVRLGRLLKMAKGVKTKESNDLMNFIAEKSCKTIKEMMQLQKQQLSKKQFEQEWNKNSLLQHLLTLFCNVMFLPIEKRRNALEHINNSLFQQFEMESRTAWKSLCQLKEEFWIKIATQKKNSAILKEFQVLLLMARDNIDSMSLGLEHFFREVGQIYEIVLASSETNRENKVLQVPRLYAELFAAGHVIELLDGDAATIPRAWFTAMGNHILQLHPDLTIYVISILGLQSSGKSTLLNALFACNFVASVGRCTKGLFIRLMFLSEDLRKKLKVDAFLLIDTEGLGAPEKFNDEEAEKADRRMATFAMGMSNLTLINVLGESMSDLMEILQIAIIAMARLEQAAMQPDIFLVQHLSERNHQKTSKAVEQFVEALKKAMELTEKKAMEVGILNSRSLHNLMARIATGEILKQFRPFKHGASPNAPPSLEYHEDVVDLFNSILTRCQNDHGTKLKFKQWYELIQSYWEAIAKENFAVRFKNIKEMYDFIERGNRIGKVKEFIRKAIQKHATNLEAILRQNIRQAQSSQQQETVATDDTLSNDFMLQATDVLEQIPNWCGNLNNEAGKPCSECTDLIAAQTELFNYVHSSEFEKEVTQTIYDYLKNAKKRKLVVLRQMLDAEIVREGCSMEFMLEINNQVKKALENRMLYQSDKTDADIAEKIWRKLRQIAAPKAAVVPMSRRFASQLENEYDNAQNIVAGFQKGELPDLQSLNAYEKKGLFGKKHETNLSQNKATRLYAKLHSLSEFILKDMSGAEHFQEGMIAQLNKRVSNILCELERDYKIKLLTNFKFSCHLYALLILSKELKTVQEKWDESHNPLKIIEKRKHELMKIIHTRLQYGFSADSDGRVAAMSLLSAVKQLAENSAYIYKCKHILDVSWMTNSENIRLKYFSEIAEQVNQADNEKALLHFQNPKHEIEGWFKKQVDNVSDIREMDEFRKTFYSELKHVTQEIRNCGTVSEIQKYVAVCLSTVVDIHYNSGIDANSMTENDAKVFQESILNILGDSALQSQFSRKPTFKKPSENEEILLRLGCTEFCPWCGAICWGQRGHHENSDDTRKHHSCHQPGGLIAVHYRV